ncbi:MAG: ABC transporter permease [Phycisphaerae bacterium]|nr:ABC transporter permease [Phycisphaerae bacterium]
MTFNELARLGRIAFPLVALFSIVGAAPLFAPRFLTTGNILVILSEAICILPAVVGMQSVMVVGRFDLSIGANSALSGIVAGLLLQSGHSLALALALGGIAALLVSTLNGLLIGLWRLDVLISTLGTMWIVRSLALVLSDGKTTGSLAVPLMPLTHASMLNMPLPIIASLLFLGLLIVLFSQQLHCRHLYAIGSNEHAARLSGLNVPFGVMLAYWIAGVGASLTGFIQMLRSEAASPLVFQDLALESIAACVLGGATLAGGRGSMLGAALGLVTIVAIQNLVLAMGISTYWRYCMIGSLVMIAIMLDRLGLSGKCSRI